LFTSHAAPSSLPSFPTRRSSDLIEADLSVVSTGSLGLDLALGVGGLPRGRVVEIYGPESSGKTTLALECIAEAQKRGGVCAFIEDRKSTRLNSSHVAISYAVFCL